MKLIIQRNPKIIVASVEIDEATVYSSELVGMDKVTASFYHHQAIDFRIDDYIEHNGRIFQIKTAVQGQQIDTNTYLYNPVFYAEIYALYDELLMHEGRTTFSYTGTPVEMLRLIVASMNTEAAGVWSLGQYANIDEPQTFTFTEQSCRTALSDIAAKFNLEYKVENKKIHLVSKIGITHDFTLKYGRGKGLLPSTRTVVDKPFATVWYGFGGTQNLPATYRNGQDKVTIDAPVQKNVSLYGKKKGSITFPDVFPKRTATVTSVVDMNTIVDTTIDFDLNAQIINDSAKIVFKTGELGGQEFVITSYNHTTKTIKFGSNKDSSGYVLPNSTFNPSVGDKYTLIGITMPQSYINAAEAEVLRLTTLHAESNSYPPVAFPLEIDEKYIREMQLAFKINAGDSLKVQSDELGINGTMRLQSVSYPLVNPCKLTGVVSDSIQYSVQEKLIKEVKDAKKELSTVSGVALNSKKIADEIINAALVNQFEKTYVGDLAVLSGAFIVGNPDSGQVGGVSGSGTELTEVVFFAGSSYANRGIAPFRALRNGNTFASKLEVANGCKIGAFTVEENVLYRKTATDPVTANTNYVRIGDDFVFRKTLGDYSAKEIAFALNNPVGTPNYSVKIGNSTNPTAGQDVIGLYVYASGATAGGKSIAISTDGAIDLHGKVYTDGHEGASTTITISGTTLIFRNGILTTT